MRITGERPFSPSRAPNTVSPRKSAPLPTQFEPLQLDMSPITSDAERTRERDREGTARKNTHQDYHPPNNSPRDVKTGRGVEASSAHGLHYHNTVGEGDLSIGQLGDSSAPNREVSLDKRALLPL